MHTPFTQRSWSGLTMPLSRHSVGTYQETSSHATRSQSSHLAEPLWTDPGLKSWIIVRELISTKKNKKQKNKKTKPQKGNELSNILPKSSHARKKATSTQAERYKSATASVCSGGGGQNGGCLATLTRCRERSIYFRSGGTNERPLQPSHPFFGSCSDHRHS